MKLYIGKFNQEEIHAGIDRKVVEEARKSNPELRYSETKITGRGQNKYLKIWIMDLEEYARSKAL